ncbi:transposase family protein [Ornithinimicrobium sp. LYQ121]|uniref:transposase family protein n=1 Tax=Ornithinimicrobium sp. LYQ121 TaxID=3378801 RepID=UPI003851A1CA
MVPDPRDLRGGRYPLAGVLAVTVCAVRTGAPSFAAIAEFGLDLGAGQLARLGLERAAVESTVRKLFGRLGARALDAALTVFAWCRVRGIEGRRVLPSTTRPFVVLARKRPPRRI